MTTVLLLRCADAGDDSILTGVRVSGHSGYAPEGRDIVCAAITGAMRMLDCILQDRMGINTHPEIDAEAASVSLTLTGAQAGDKAVQDVLAGFGRYMTEIAGEYPEHVRVIYREE